MRVRASWFGLPAKRRAKVRAFRHGISRAWVGLLLSLFIACDTGPIGEGRRWSVDDLAVRYPAVAPMLAEAVKSPPEVVNAGAGEFFRVRSSARRDAPPAPVMTGGGGRPGRWQSTSRGVRVDILDDGAATMRVGVDEGGVQVTVRRVGATGASLAVEANAVVVRGASPGVDAVLFAKENAVEELLVAQGPDRGVAYDFELPPGWRLHRPEGFAGVVEVRDRNEIAWLRMRAREGWDASGRSIGVAPIVDGCRVRVVMSADAVWPVVVDPAWESTGNMLEPRADHTATLLPNGKVLIAGGGAGNKPPEIYDPTTRTFSASGWVPGVVLAYGTATLLLDGHVLLAGHHPYKSVLYDPSEDTFSSNNNSMQADRVGYTATLLSNGEVLLAGGDQGGLSPENPAEPAGSMAEIYNPVSREFKEMPPMPSAHRFHTATYLPDGSAFIFGGDGDPGYSPDIYDPANEQFFSVPYPFPQTTCNTATLLPDGNVLLAGGLAPGAGKTAPSR